MYGLSDLVRRRLWELGSSPDEASRRSNWVIPSEVMRRLASGGKTVISSGLARPLARAIDVTENRLRRAAGLPLVFDPRVEIDTRPHLRVVGQDSDPLSDQ
jgi:hypothetical protein